MSKRKTHIGKAPNAPLQTNTLHAIRLRTSYELQKINMHISCTHAINKKIIKI